LEAKGYGTDAMKLILRYILSSNLRRVSLDVFEYNQRAIRSYEGGFQLKSCVPGHPA
jgi:RimJ/RimL family protein N-acetyltransferase